MTPLPKTMTKVGPHETKQIRYHSKGIDNSFPKVCFLLNLSHPKVCFLLILSHCVKSYGHFCQILAIFTMPDYQILSCHMTQDGNFETFYFVLILHLILGKVTKFLVEKLSTAKVISRNLTGGRKQPPRPVPLGFKGHNF